MASGILAILARRGNVSCIVDSLGVMVELEKTNGRLVQPPARNATIHTHRHPQSRPDADDGVPQSKCWRPGEPKLQRHPRSFWQTLATLTLFGVSFGYVEAAAVVYLGELYKPLAREFYPSRKPGDLFPLITLEQLQTTDSVHLRLLKAELAREAATMVMLASVGLAIGWNFNTCFAAFVIGFGVWDICYYVFLRVLTDWPTSLLDWDLLFLIPLPWVGPVLAPVLVAISMIGAGAILIWRERVEGPVRIGWQRWSIMLLGGLTIVVSFCWDYRHIMAGGMPERFPWPIFFLGQIAGLAAFSTALLRRRDAGLAASA
jgi:hypothetical protein